MARHAGTLAALVLSCRSVAETKGHGLEQPQQEPVR